MRLTDIRIKSLRAPMSGQKTHFDEALPGFGVRVSQGGTKAFVVMYGPKRQLKTLGRYPTLTLAEARKAAKIVQAEALAESAEPPRFEPVSFEDARRRFLADSHRRNKERTYLGYHRLLHRHFHFQKNIGDLTRADVMGAIEQLAATPSEQQHAFVAIRIMLNWCEKQGFIDRSPAPAMSFRQAARSNVLSDADLAGVWQRAVELGYPYGSIVQLLLLTGQRRGEIAALRRSWIEGDLIVFPEGFTKNKREHRLPLSAMAQAVIAAVPNTGDLLFPARGSDDRPFNGWGKSKERFDKPLEVAPYTLHDLRRTFSSNLARLGTPIHVTEKLLNHISGTVSGVAAVYNRYSYLDEMREAVAAHDEFLADLVAE
ncbi:MAG: site-specific integrase [Pseudomonadota bacterium]